MLDSFFPCCSHHLPSLSPASEFQGPKPGVPEGGRAVAAPRGPGGRLLFPPLPLVPGSSSLPPPVCRSLSISALLLSQNQFPGIIVFSGWLPPPCQHHARKFQPARPHEASLEGKMGVHVSGGCRGQTPSLLRGTEKQRMGRTEVEDLETVPPSVSLVAHPTSPDYHRGSITQDSLGVQVVVQGTGQG